MHGNRLIFSRGGITSGQTPGPQRRFGVSPFYFPQRGLLNGYYLPDEHELPLHGLITQMLAFDFGFATPSLQIGANDAQYFSITLGGNFLAISITGVSDIPPSQGRLPTTGALSGVQVDPAYLVTFQQTHQGSTWQWSNKACTNREICGTGYNPFPFKSPVLIPAGDTLGCTVQNLTNTSLRVQIMLMGGTF